MSSAITVSPSAALAEKRSSDPSLRSGSTSRDGFMKHHSRRHVLPVLATVTWILGAVSPLLTCDLAIAQTQVAPAKATQSQTAPARPAAAKAEDKKLLKSKDFYLKKEDPGKFEQLARQKREEAIVLLKGILDSGNIEGDQLAEMNMRLAELYWERAKDFYLAEMAAHLEEYGTWADSKDPNKGAAPQENHNNSQLSNRLAIDLYRTILQKHRNYPRMDEVYFNLAFNLMDLGEKQQALEYYQTLVKNYPQSDFVADAYLAMGEHYFENNNAFKALGIYNTEEVERIIREHQRIVAGNLEYILQLARSMNVGVILANQSMEDLRTRTTDLIPTLEANCRYRQWFAVSSSDDRARVVANSGETLEDFVTRSVSENGESYTYIPKLMPRLSQNAVLLITDHRKQSIVTLTRGKGYAQYGGMAVAVESEFHISLAEYQARRRMPWPDAGYGSFIPRTLRAAISKLITPPTPRGPVVTTEFFGRTPDDDSASGPVILPPRPGNGPKRPTAGKKRKDVE